MSARDSRFYNARSSLCFLLISHFARARLSLSQFFYVLSSLSSAPPVSSTYVNFYSYTYITKCKFSLFPNNDSAHCRFHETYSYIVGKFQGVALGPTHTAGGEDFAERDLTYYILIVYTESKR